MTMLRTTEPRTTALRAAVLQTTALQTTERMVEVGSAEMVVDSPSESLRDGVSTEESLAAATERALRTSPYPALWRVSCALHDGQLVLRGQVRSFFLKQMAQVLASREARGIPIENRVEVVD